MDFLELSLPGVFLITPRKFGDERGFFSETFSQPVFEQHVQGFQFVQDNHSLSTTPGTLRGLHFQKPPFEQGKLVRVTEGRVLDVIVDIRKGSPTYGQHLSVELSAENWQQLWVPPGFAHGFCTLTERAAFLYKVTKPYAPDHEGGLIFNDKTLNIKWPFAASDVTLSAKDRDLPSFDHFESPFTFHSPDTTEKVSP